MEIIIVIIILVLVSLLFLVAVIRASKIYKITPIKGENFGEKRVNRFLDNIKKEKEVVINDYLVTTNIDGTRSTEIDHIFISYKGIFVIETKDLSGIIYGDAYEDHWTQYLIGPNLKHDLYNPIKQNDGHIRFIKKLIGDHYYFYNIAIFTKADTSNVFARGNKLFDIISFTKYYKDLKDDIYIDDKEIELINNKLLNYKETHSITKKEHVENVRRNLILK